MFSRISSAILLAASLAACSVKDDAGATAQGEGGDAVGAAAQIAEVPCALAGSKRFGDRCAVEHLSQDGKRYVLLRHPDGGFRRLIELEDGKRYAAADGAESADMTPNDGGIEVSVGDDSYLFAAPAGSHAPGS